MAVEREVSHSDKVVLVFVAREEIELKCGFAAIDSLRFDLQIEGNCLRLFDPFTKDGRMPCGTVVQPSSGAYAESHSYSHQDEIK